MQESLYNTIKKLHTEDKVNVEELEHILGTDIDEVVGLCKKACLKPKTDDMGNAYFTKNDVDTLKKVRELYSEAKEKQDEIVQSTIETAAQDSPAPTKTGTNLLQRAKNRIKHEQIFSSQNSLSSSGIHNRNIQEQFEKFENNLMRKMSELLSEKMDGFDEIIVELIRSKTENENLRGQINDMNRQLFVLKKEIASFQPLPFGLYTKKETDEL